MSVHIQISRVTTTQLRKMKEAGEKIAMLTSYDFTLTSLIDEAGIDMILVGDSASNVVCGNQYTLPITMDEMIFLTPSCKSFSPASFILRNWVVVTREICTCNTPHYSGRSARSRSSGTHATVGKPIRRIRTTCERRSRSRETFTRCQTIG